MSLNVFINSDNGIIKSQAKAGQTIKEILSDADIFLDAPCGGNGTCGKCRIIASGGVSELSENEKILLSEQEIKQGIRLACCTNITGEVSITLPKSEEAQIAKGFSSQLEFKPHFKTQFVDMIAPTLLNPIDDKTNLLQVAGAASITYDAIKKLSEITKTTRKNLFIIKNSNTIIDVFAVPNPVYGMAVDIGTTTVVAYFYDLITGNLIDTESGLNEQRSCGADVISRISACIEKPSGLNDLQMLIINEINSFIDNFCKKINTNSENIYFATVAGNTTMLHIAAGINPANIANAPFIPVSLFGGSYSLCKQVLI